MIVVAAIAVFLMPSVNSNLKAKEPEKNTASVSQTTTATTATTTDVTQSVTTAVPEKNQESKTVTTSAAQKTEGTKTVTTAATTAQTKKATTTTASGTASKTTVKTTTKATAASSAATTAKKASSGSSTSASGKTPVEIHGQLSVSGTNIVDKNGNVFQLRGVSTHGIGWFPEAVSQNNFKVLRDDWGCNAVRLAMYIEESWGGSEQCYLQDKERNLQLVKKGIDYAIAEGMYVIVDWHILNPGDPSKYTAEAKAFFETIAKEYKDCPNIIYELCNEPNGGVNWTGTIKPYCEQVLSVIRKYDSDAIVVCGTGTWSQDIHEVVGNTINDKNVVYALHFYANTHTDWLRDRLKSCINSGVPVLVTEFGTCDASGNGGFNTEQTKKWLETMDSLNVGYFNWSLCNKAETASIMTSSSSLSSLKAGTSQLTESGKLIRQEYRKRAGLD